MAARTKRAGLARLKSDNYGRGKKPTPISAFGNGGLRGVSFQTRF
jgi:hypothetical protein